MSPLKIHLLLNLYHSPNVGSMYSVAQREAPAMKEAFEEFEQRGLLAYSVSYESIMVNPREQFPQLSEKGLELVERLCEVQP